MHSQRVVGNFYRAMHDYQADADLSRMLDCTEVLGMPRGQSMTVTRDGRDLDVAGFGQPATMRAWLIQGALRPAGIGDTADGLRQPGPGKPAITTCCSATLLPVRSCDKGNACHGCDHFAADRSHLPEIRRQLTTAEQLIEHRKAQHQARYGEPMTDSSIWLKQRLAEARSMRLEISALAALGELLRLRRLLQQHGVAAACERRSLATGSHWPFSGDAPAPEPDRRTPYQQLKPSRGMKTYTWLPAATRTWPLTEHQEPAH